MKRFHYSLTMQIWLMMVVTTVSFALIFGVFIYHAISNEGQHQLTMEHQQIMANPEAAQWLGTEREEIIHYLIHADTEAWQYFCRNAWVPGLREQKNVSETVIAELVPDESMHEFAMMDPYGRHWLISYLSGSDQYLVSAFFPSVKREILPILGLTLIVLLLGMAHAVIMHRYVVRPIHQLTVYAGQIAARCPLTPFNSRHSAKEVGELIEAMNDMQCLLRKNDEEQQAFLQSISHDLKTPVAVILAHAQALIDGVYVGSAEHNAEVIKAEAARLQDKIQKILYYNTLEYMMSSAEDWQFVNVPELLDDLTRRFSAMRPNLHWQTETRPAWIHADEENLRVALENILDNALRYAHEKIEISNACADDMVIITIANDGAPIEHHQLESLFHQLSKGKNGNFGLGLFISYKIITCSGGTIAAYNVSNGVQFVITLPEAKNKEV